MKSWRLAWRKGFGPQFSPAALRALRDALATDDPRLLQGAITSPPPLECVRDWPVESAGPICFAGWQGEGLETVAEVEEFFARACVKADQAMDEPAACRWFLNAFDDTPRAEMWPALLADVERSLRLAQGLPVEEEEEAA